MSFIGRLFTRKRGGTRVGNFIRKVAYENTYGLLGTNDFSNVNPDASTESVTIGSIFSQPKNSGIITKL